VRDLICKSYVGCIILYLSYLEKHHTQFQHYTMQDCEFCLNDENPHSGTANCDPLPCTFDYDFDHAVTPTGVRLALHDDPQRFPSALTISYCAPLPPAAGRCSSHAPSRACGFANRPLRVGADDAAGGWTVFDQLSGAEIPTPTSEVRKGPAPFHGASGSPRVAADPARKRGQVFVDVRLDGASVGSSGSACSSTPTAPAQIALTADPGLCVDGHGGDPFSGMLVGPPPPAPPRAVRDRARCRCTPGGARRATTSGSSTRSATSCAARTARIGGAPASREINVSQANSAENAKRATGQVDAIWPADDPRSNQQAGSGRDTSGDSNFCLDIVEDGPDVQLLECGQADTWELSWIPGSGSFQVHSTTHAELCLYAYAKA
jgi:hypothetical protein